ncbi:MAG: hypothetical protein NVSMB21_25970 [Vulcanimicrobiaceae bacterium]
MFAAAIAYTLNAILIVPYALTFPNVVDPTGFIGNEQSAVCLWTLWHLAFPILVATGFRARRETVDGAAPRGRRIALGVAATAAIAALAGRAVLARARVHISEPTRPTATDP